MSSIIAKIFLQQLLSQGIDSVDYVFSTNATDSYTAQIAQIMTPQGKLGLIDDPQTFDIMPLKLKFYLYALGIDVYPLDV